MRFALPREAEIVHRGTPEPCWVAFGVTLQRLEIRFTGGAYEPAQAGGRRRVGGGTPRGVGHIASEGGPGRLHCGHRIEIGGLPRPLGGDRWVTLNE